MDDYLPRILRARVYDVARESPLESANNLSRRLNNHVWLKREDLQPVFSFKLRGAYNRMVQLSEQERERGVIAASAGNHAQGVALSASHLQCRAVIASFSRCRSIRGHATGAIRDSCAPCDLTVCRHRIIPLTADIFTNVFEMAIPT